MIVFVLLILVVLGNVQILHHDENITVSVITNSTGIYIGFPEIEAGLHILTANVTSDDFTHVSIDPASLTTVAETDEFTATDVVGIRLDTTFISGQMKAAHTEMEPELAEMEPEHAEAEHAEAEHAEAEHAEAEHAMNKYRFLVRLLGRELIVDKYEDSLEFYEVHVSDFTLKLQPTTYNPLIITHGLVAWDESGFSSSPETVLGFSLVPLSWPCTAKLTITFDKSLKHHIHDQDVYTDTAFDLLRHTSHHTLMTYLTYETGWMGSEWFTAAWNARDTLISLLLLYPILSRNTISTILSRILQSVSYTGEVCFSGGSQEGTCVYDAIDVTLLLPTVLDAIANLHPDLAGQLSQTYKRAILMNARHIVSMARPFAEDPGNYRLMIKRKFPNATWRNSAAGLAGSLYPMDLNAVYMPAALQALIRLESRGLLLDLKDHLAFYALRWELHSQTFFETWIDPEDLDEALSLYVRYGVPEYPDLRPLLRRGGSAVTQILGIGMLDDGTVVPLITSDSALVLLLRPVSSAFAIRLAELVLTPYPRGLRTDVGILASNPAYLWAHPRFRDSEFVELLNTTCEHGLTVHRWQHSVWETALQARLSHAETRDERLALTDAVNVLRDFTSLVAKPAQTLHHPWWTFTYSPNTDTYTRQFLEKTDWRPTPLALTIQSTLMMREEQIGEGTTTTTLSTILLTLLLAQAIYTV